MENQALPCPDFALESGFMRAYVLAITFLASLWAASPVLAADKREHLIVSGGPASLNWERLRFPADQHDKFHFNFVRPAAWSRIPQLIKLYGKDAHITWLVYRPAYERRQRESGKPLIQWIESVIRKYPTVKLVWFSSTDELIRYINSGQNRRRLKIGSIDFYLHSNKYCFMFDYSSEILGCSKEFLHIRDIKRLKRRAFAKEAQSKSWGCHTGESMSAHWRKATGTKLWGAIGKTDYSDISINKGVPKLSPGGRWSY